MTPEQLELFHGNLGVARAAAVHVVRRIPAARCCIDDLTQEGRIAVLRATKTHDPARGSFERYAYYAAYNAAVVAAFKAVRSASGYGKNNDAHREHRVDATSPRARRIPAAVDVEGTIAAREVASVVGRRLGVVALSKKHGATTQDAADFVAWIIGDASIWDLAKDRGFSRQALHVRFKPVRAEFETVAAELRAEAA